MKAKQIQIFAYTPPTLPAPHTTPYLAVFKEPSDLVTIGVRGKDGAIGEITITVAEALKLSIALGAAKFSHEVVAAIAERRELDPKV